MTQKLAFTCQQSGKCCKIYASGRIIASPKDLERWKALGREDILQKVRVFYSDEKTIIGGEFCEDPQSNREASTCPFVDLSSGKAICSIHDVKPEACAQYPYDSNGKIREELLGVCDGVVQVKVRV